MSGEDRKDPDSRRADSNAYRMDRSDPAYRGQATYTPRLLRVYNQVVVRFSNTFVWRCPASRIQEHYERFLAERHLDIGPGTGYYLDRARFPTPTPDITLLDPNPAVLEYTAARIARYRPTTHAANALEPIDLPARSFGSIGVSYVLHCLPGTMAEKAVLFDHLRPLLAPGGHLFGATILGEPHRHSPLGRTLMKIYNAKGVFSNIDDDLPALRRELTARFDETVIDVVGAVALFSAIQRRSRSS